MDQDSNLILRIYGYGGIGHSWYNIGRLRLNHETEDGLEANAVFSNFYAFVTTETGSSYVPIPNGGYEASDLVIEIREEDIPDGTEHIEVGFTFFETVSGAEARIDPHSPPESVELAAIQFYSGGIVEVGAYVGDTFRLMGFVEVKGDDWWTRSHLIKLESVDEALKPKLHIRFSDVDTTGGGYEGVVGVYTEPANDWDQYSTRYRAAFPFSQGPEYLYQGQSTYVTSILFSRGEEETHTDYLESSFTPLINGIPAPIDPESPPSSISIYSSRALVGGNIQVGAYVGGEFVVMGQSDELFYGWDIMREEVQLTPVTGPVDSGGQVFIRLVNHDYADDKSHYPNVAVTLEATKSDNATAVYSPEYQVIPTAIAYGESYYAGGISLSSVDFPSQGDLPTFRTITYSDGLKAEVDPLNPPPFIKAFAMNHTAGGKIQVGAYQEDGEFFVMGEQDLPTVDDGEASLYDIPLIALPPPTVRYFWTGFLRTTEYAKGIGQ